MFRLVVLCGSRPDDEGWNHIARTANLPVTGKAASQRWLSLCSLIDKRKYSYYRVAELVQRLRGKPQPPKPQKLMKKVPSTLPSTWLMQWDVVLLQGVETCGTQGKTTCDEDDKRGRESNNQQTDMSKQHEKKKREQQPPDRQGQHERWSCVIYFETDGFVLFLDSFLCFFCGLCCVFIP